eukprot:jgi/Chrzof1/9420/Cz04g02130.t1
MFNHNAASDFADSKPQQGGVTDTYSSQVSADLLSTWTASEGGPKNNNADPNPDYWNHPFLTPPPPPSPKQLALAASSMVSAHQQCHYTVTIERT